MGDSADARHFECGGHAIDIIVHGYPGKSVCHGSLGWSTIALVRHGARKALVDVGSFGQRKLLLEYFGAHGLQPGDITDVLLTHSHYDHSINWVLFPDAAIVIGGHELEWSLEQPWYDNGAVDAYAKRLYPLVKQALDGDGEMDERFLRQAISIYEKREAPSVTPRSP